MNAIFLLLLAFDELVIFGKSLSAFTFLHLNLSMLGPFPYLCW